MQIYVQALPPTDPTCPRSRREREATLSMLTAIFGPEVEYSHTPAGAPVVKVKDEERLVSVSHSATTLAIATADGETALGIDVETYRPQLDRVKSRFLSTEEQGLFAGPLALLKAWTTKEAVYKAALTPGLALDEIDCTRLDEEGIATARGINYRITFHAATPGQCITTAHRDSED